MTSHTKCSPVSRSSIRIAPVPSVQIKANSSESLFQNELRRLMRTYRIRIIVITGHKDLHSIWKLSIKFVFQIEKFDRIRIFFGQFSTFESFYRLRQSITATRQIETPYQQNQRFAIFVVDDTANFISEKCHSGVFAIVDWIVWIIWIDAARIECSIGPRTLFCFG